MTVGTALPAMTIADGVGVVEIDHPPVSLLSLPVRRQLAAACIAMIADPDVSSIVIACAGRTFFVGADIAEFGKPIEPPDVVALTAMLEASPKPVVAAIHGAALGGGFEIALACHYRIAADSARVGLPEVLLGILPGAGGTQRVPRLIGAAAAFEMLASGRQIGAAEALALGLIDGVVAGDALRSEAIQLARSIAAKPLSRVSELDGWTLRDRAALGKLRSLLACDDGKYSGLEAPKAIAKAIEAAVCLPFWQGLALEGELCRHLMTSPNFAEKCARFFAERKA